MPKPARNNTAGLLLMAAPWPLYNRPSIQLGALKAYLQRRFPGMRIDARHLYLPLAASIGYPLYQAISERTWLAEAVYAALLYPEHFETIDGFFRRRAAAAGDRLRRTDLKTLSSRVREDTDRLLKQISWKNYAMAGFSVSLCQLSATLYVLRRVKQIAPRLTCVVGGSSFSGIPPQPVFRLFDAIDLIISGEGELPLADLVKLHLLEGLPVDALPPIAGLHRRHLTPPATDSTMHQMPSLQELPPPDYDDYFEQLERLPPERRFFATLPLELSRGCRWQRRRRGGETAGCAFCNLNLQWHGYRRKPSEQALAEIDLLTARYQTLSIAFADNLLPADSTGRLFQAVGGLKKDLRLFGEIRATTGPGALKNMRAAGMSEVQIGIEALSGSLLRKLGKGTRAIDNLAAMKNCEELGIKNISNLILLFPGSDRRDVEETLQALEFVLPFRPLKTVDFWMGLGSPLWQNRRQAGIRAVFNHRNWSHLFPDPIARHFPFTILGYRGDRVRQKRLWQPVRAAVKNWERLWRRLHTEPHSDPILSYRDGRDFMIIRQRRPLSPPLTHRLPKTSAGIYRCCRQPQSFSEIRSRFRDLPAGSIRAFLESMVAKRLMFSEEDHFLSLAVSESATYRQF